MTAAESPAGPAPIIATFLPFSFTGGRGTTHPFAKAVSMISFSVCLTITDSSSSCRTQLASQSAGQMRDVNSGKSLFADKRSYARRKSPAKTARFWSGTRFPSGQPAPWQNGMPQFWQRSVCFRASSGDSMRSTSLKSRLRSSVGRYMSCIRFMISLRLSKADCKLRANCGIARSFTFFVLEYADRDFMC